MKLFEKKEVSHHEIKETQKEIDKLNEIVSKLISRYEHSDPAMKSFIMTALEDQIQFIQDLKTIHPTREQ